MTSSAREHWQDIYRKKNPDEQTWYQRKPTISLELIDEVAGEGPVRIVDVGGGASTLVDFLVDDGRFDVTVVDIAPAALAASRERLGRRAEDVEWLPADLTEPLELDAHVDIWHDRAVLHFLREPDERAAYLENLERNVAPDGHVVLSTFAIDGPETCSGLEIRQYSPELMAETLGEDWQLVESRYEDHPTPWGGEQRFVYGLFERTP